MKSDIPENVGETLREIGMTPDQAGWNCHGTYVLLHKALEKVAVKKGHLHPTIRTATHMLWLKREPKTGLS